MKSEGYKSPRSSRASVRTPSSEYSEASINQLKERFTKLPPISQSDGENQKDSTSKRTTSPESRRTSKSTEGSYKKSQHRKLFSFPNSTEESRRKSFPFPVTAWLSRCRQTPETEEDTPTTPRPYRSSRSQGEIEASPKLRRQSSWKVSMLVAKAKDKFTDAKVAKRRLSLSDFVKVAVMKRPDAEKRKMIREIKKKAHQHRVSVTAKICLVRDSLVVLKLSLVLSCPCRPGRRHGTIRDRCARDARFPH